MLVLLCSVTVVVSFAMVRPKPTSFSNPSWYWQAKVEWKKCANIVLAGNSRTYRGLSPVEFEKVLGGKAVNAGFSSGRYSEEYCDYLATLFEDDQSTHKILVAGICHGAICNLDIKNSGFLDALKKSKESTLTAEQQKQTDKYDIAFGSLIKINYVDNNNYIQEFFANGWVSSDYRKRDVNYSLLSYKKAYNQGDKYLCSEQEIEIVISSFNKLSSKGIQVFCLWLPTSPQMTKLENIESGMKANEIEYIFKERGIKWISFPDTDYISYDGSHLETKSATRLSFNTAVEIKNHIK